MMPGEVHTVRGVTGTVKELMYAFGVQVGWACVRTRRSNYGWSMEKCLLYRGYKPPLYANNPRPIIRNGDPLTHWELAREAAEQRFDCSLREILIAVADAGLYTPVWSPRILAEWRHAAARLGAYLAALAAVFVAAFFIGGAVVPQSTVDSWTQQAEES